MAAAPWVRPAEAPRQAPPPHSAATASAGADQTGAQPRSLPTEQPAGSTRPADGMASSASPPAQAERRPARAAEPPRFDVVRMGARGMMVVAGRAAPGAEVILYEGGREIGRARADGRGEWVILPADPIGAGARELSLRARLPGGEEMGGPDTVLVVGPSTADPRMAQATARPEGQGPRREEPAKPAEAVAGNQQAPRQGDQPSPAATQRAGIQAGAEERGAATPARTEPRQEEPARTAEAAPAAETRAEQPLVLLLPPTAEAAPRSLSAPTGGAATAPLGLDIVDYDDSNTMRFAGTAAPGARLRLYADGRHLGDTAADAAGRWSLAPAEPPAVGRHTLRVDQFAAGQEQVQVANRIEVAFQRESLSPGALGEGRVVVQPGNNLWRIARDAYGRGIRYTVIYRANQAQIRNPSRIYPGQVFSVPSVP
ncbi:LysM peptidoglycan-binding domain-containing protein [Roseomonas sp. SSH11]|uniref:LysM peptidoglycan-binding domain-containing protein n=2 Tax=Pararoseomonas baculiformis TaxID=2820812 RepID=A0ABS4AEQ7_9PROT|nr:LysM peptidoglycan-binding domain-containing protein [Pararoseomonas baculiformis]